MRDSQSMDLTSSPARHAGLAVRVYLRAMGNAWERLSRGTRSIRVMAGCFASHRFDAVWKQVKPIVPIQIPPTDNVWLRAYRKQFPQFFAR